MRPDDATTLDSFLRPAEYRERWLAIDPRHDRSCLVALRCIELERHTARARAARRCRLAHEARTRFLQETPA